METKNSKTAPIVQEKDQNQVTLDLMRRMRLTGMANAFEGNYSAINLGDDILVGVNVT